MNLFDTLIANKPATQNIQSPVTPKQGATNFFSDEKQVYDRMLNDGLDDTKARSLITKQRQKMIGQITSQEKEVLLKMQQDGLDSKKAVELVRKNRYNNLPLYKKAAKFVFDAGVGAAGLATEQVGKVGGFLGAEEFERKGIEARDIAKRTTGDSIGAKTGETILGAGEMFAVSPTKVAPTLFGRTLQGAAVGGVIGGADPILSKGSDATIGDVAKGAAIGGTIGAVATPIIEKAVLPIIAGTVAKGYGAGKFGVEKAVKYGTAAQKGGLEGLEKSIVRDIKSPFKSIQLEGLAPQKAAALSTRANRFTSGQEKKFKEMTGETSGEFAVKRGMTKVGDDAVEESAKNYLASMKEADDALRLIDGNYKITKGQDFAKIMLEDLSSRLKNTLGTGSRKIDLLLKKYNTQGLTMSELNQVKRTYANNFKYSFTEKGSEAAMKSTNLQNGIRKFQFDTAKQQGFNNLDKINKTTQAWRAYTDNLGQSMARKGVNNEVNLTSWIALSGGEPTNLALFLGKETLGHSKVKGAIIKGLSKQTKPSIIKANRTSILKSNLKKENVVIDNILRDRSINSSKLVKTTPKKVVKKPIITKAPVKTEKAISNKKGFIAPRKIISDVKKVIKPTKSAGLIEEAKNFKQTNLDSLIKQAKETGKMPLNEDISKGFIKQPSLLQRKAELDKIKDILKKEANIKDIIPNKTLSAIEKYTKHQGRINAYLRNPNGGHLEDTIKLAKEAEKQLLEMPKYEGISYRGVKQFSGLDNLQVGQTFSDKGFLSSSKSKIVADRFADDALFIIKGKRGRDLSDISKMKSEQEILFKPNSKFDIINIETKGGKKIITLEQ